MNKYEKTAQADSYWLALVVPPAIMLLCYAVALCITLATLLLVG